MYTGHEIYNLHIVLVLTCPFVLSAIYCEQVEKQVIEFSFSSILHTDTGLCQSSLVSPIKPIVHSKAPKPKVFAPPTLLVSKTPATRGAQELSNFTRVLLVVTRNYVWIMLPIVVSVTVQTLLPSYYLTTKRDRERQYHQASNQMAPKVIPMLAHGCLSPIL